MIAESLMKITENRQMQYKKKYLENFSNPIGVQKSDVQSFSVFSERGSVKIFRSERYRVEGLNCFQVGYFGHQNQICVSSAKQLKPN